MLREGSSLRSGGYSSLRNHIGGSRRLLHGLDIFRDGRDLHVPELFKAELIQIQRGIPVGVGTLRMGGRERSRDGYQENAT